VIKLIVGSLIGVLSIEVFGNIFIVTTVFFAAAVILQIAYPKILKKYLGGTGSAASAGMKNIKELKNLVEIPFYIQAAEFATESAWYALAAAILFKVIFVKS